MTICPFMSGPVAEGVARGGSRGCVPDLYEVECLREKCAAWGPVEPLWILEREGGETREYYVTWFEGKWQRIPKKPDQELIICGCRRIGYEVPE